MLKKSIKFTDYNGVERTEDFYFNLSKGDMLELELGIAGGLSGAIDRIIETEDKAAMYALFKKIVLSAYGKKSADGRLFVKREDMSVEFSQTEAFSELMTELMTSEEELNLFIQSVVNVPANTVSNTASNTVSFTPNSERQQNLFNDRENPQYLRP